MRFSKGEEDDRGRREKRRRSRERAREARRRRQELERRAAELQKATGSTGPERKDDGAPKSGKKAAAAPKAPRKLRRKRGAGERPGKSAAGRARTLRQIPGEVGRRLSLPQLAAALAVAGRVLGRGIGYILVVVLRLAALVERLIRWLVGRVGPPVAALVAVTGRLVTPKRAAVVVAIAAGLAAVASQAFDYRAVEIGGDAYADVASLAQAPLAEHRTPWSVHGPLVGLLALVGAGAAVLALRGGGRRAPAVALAAVAAGLLIILALDLPRAGDLGEAAAEYAGAESVLLEGFYIELCAILLIGFTALLPSLWKRKVS